MAAIINKLISANEPIAIIGMSCRFPAGANSPDEYWKLLESGTDAVIDIPPSRWDKDAYYDPDGSAPGKMYTKRGGFMNIAVDCFDSPFFRVSPKEANDMDPQQRILLELGWECLEDAGIDPESIRGMDVGVFIGVSDNEYSDICVHGDIDRVTSYSLSGNCYSGLAGRISFVLGLEGPCMAIDTACSSSLVAIDNACSNLRLRKTDLALAGGFNLLLTPNRYICLTKLGALSPDGVSRAFDAQANGYVRGEGGGLVVLKRLHDALAQGDRIIGLIRSSFVNQDGQTTGISAPNQKSQEKLILSALREAGVGPEQIDYIEAHGTGTRVGDKTEISALGNVMLSARDHASPLLVGSVKSNIGHLEAASGMAGLLKILLSLRHELIPGNLHFKTPTPAVDWDRYPLRVIDKNTPWPRTDKPRLAGVSAFGFVGTNAHLVIEEPPVAPGDASSAARPFHALPLSARTPEDLKRLIRRYIDFLRDVDGEMIADICHTAALGRHHFACRAAVSGGGPEQLAERLTELLDGDLADPLGDDQRVVFLYTGQGSQYHGMGRQLYASQPVFRSALDECERIYRDVEGTSLLELLYAEGAEKERVNHTRYAQPLIFSLQHALTRLWLSLGVRPAAAAGHSIGEYSAACLAGVFSLEDALRLVAARGRLMGSVPGKGLMAAVFATREQVEAVLAEHSDGCAISAINSPENIVIGGFEDAILPVLEKLGENGVHHQLLKVSHGFHSPQMDPILDEFASAFAGVDLHEPRIPLISNATALPATTGQLTDRRYWVRHLRGAVRMSESLSWLHSQGYAIFLELGPTPTLLSFARRCVDNPRLVLAASMKQRVPDLLALSEAVGQLYQAGIDIDWNAYDQSPGRRKVSLPTYPFSGQRHWFEPSDGGKATARAAEPERSSAPGSLAYHPLIGQRLETSALPGTVLFQMEIARGRHYFFADHRIMGVETAPGAALLSWVWLAAQQLFPGQSFRLEEITFIQPMILYQADRVGQIIVRDVHARRCEFEFQSREANLDDQPWTAHARGAIVKGVTPPVQSPAPSSSAPEARHANSGEVFHVSGKEFYGRMEDLGYSYGPLFMGIQDAVSAGGEIRCSWLVPEKQSKTRDYWITPSDLDTIFQSPAVDIIRDPEASPEAGTIQIPLYLKSLAFHAQLVPGHYQIVTRESTASGEGSKFKEYQVEVLNDRAETCAVIEGYVSTAISRQELLREGRLKRLGSMIYEDQWQPRPLPESRQGATQPRGAWVLFSDRNDVGASLARRLSQQGRVCLVEPGDGFEEIGADRYRVDWRRPESFADMFQRLGFDTGQRVGVVHMLLGELCASGAASTAGNPVDVDKPLRGLLNLTQALLPTPFAGRLYVVSAGGRQLPGLDSAACMRGRGLDGFAAVAELEHPEHQVTHIDLSCLPGEPEIGRLAAELLADDAERRVCLRGDQRLVARLARCKPGDGSRAEVTLSRDGAYLITGGLGGLGLEIASVMADAHAGTIVLVGRRPPSADAEAKIEAMRRAGATILVERRDISDSRECAGLFEAIDGLPHRLRGVIHAAGIIKDSSIMQMSWDDFAPVLAPKVSGAWNLHQATQERRLDFFVMFSSAASSLGNRGQANYAAANSYMNALANYRRSLGLCANSICWGPWAEVGMAARGINPGLKMAKDGNAGIKPAEGIAAMFGVIQMDLAVPSVLDMNWGLFLDAVPEALASTYFERLGAGQALADAPALEHESSAGPDASLPSAERIRQADPTERRALVLELTRKIAAQIMGYADPSMVPTDVALTRMGMDSLMTMTLRHQVEKKLSIALPFAFLLDNNTIENIAAYILEKME